MVFEYVLKQNGIQPSELNIDQSIDFGSTAAAFSGGKGDYTVEFEPSATTIVERYQAQDTWKDDLIFTKDSFALLLDILEDAEVITKRPDYNALVTDEFAIKAKKES